MKLIRLVTDDNGNFRSSFGNDIVVKKDSKMALLNLTFQTNIGTFVTVENGNQITFRSDKDDADSEQTITIPERSYNVSEKADFYKDLQHALNKTLQSVNARGNGNFSYNSVFSAFRIATDDAGLKTVEYRYAPFVNYGLGVINPQNNQRIPIAIYQESLVTVTTVSEGVVSIAKNATGGATTGTEARLVPLNGRRLNDGNSFFSCRIKLTNDNGSGLQDNGFGIGLSKTNLGLDHLSEEIAITERNFEIRFNRATENYKYIDVVGTAEKDSGILPQRVGAGQPLTDHDVLFFEVSGNTLEMGFLYDAGANGVRHVFATTEIKAGEELYPYLYFRGTAANCVVDCVNYSVDPWLPGFAGQDDGNEQWQYTGEEDNGYDNGYGDIIDSGGVIGRVISQITQNRFYVGTQYQLKLIMPGTIWRALGFNQFKAGINGGFLNVKIGANYGRKWWQTWTARVLPVAYTSDNFIIESMNIPLDSYDASAVEYGANPAVPNPITEMAGRRKNILMTIPVNDNTSGLVEYESSTPIFVDLDNANELNLKNINLRILRKDFSPIVQGDQTAIMTLLIDN